MAAWVGERETRWAEEEERKLLGKKRERRFLAGEFENLRAFFFSSGVDFL
jgi:hypothetical protein